MLRQPIEIRRPKANFAEPGSGKEKGRYINEREDERVRELTEEYQGIFSDNPAVTIVHTHWINVTESEKLIQKVYPITIPS